jgi:hypothetical protein
MPDSAAIQNSVGNITAMFTCCFVLFGALMIRLVPKVLPGVSDSADSGRSKSQLILSVKMMASLMAVPVVFFLAVIFGEFPVLWHAFPLWCLSIGFLVVALAALILSLFWLDREDIEDYTLEFDHRAALDKKMKKQDAEKNIVVMGFGLWIAGLGASYVWLLHLAKITFSDVLHWL